MDDFPYFPYKIGFDISYKSSPKRRTVKPIFSRENKKKKKKKIINKTSSVENLHQQNKH